jgi:CheY-like chemotaxis protein
MEASPTLGSREPDAPRYVLVVDDEDDVRSAIEEILQSEGYPTMGARNGAEALELLGTNLGLPGLILLDLMMPEMDGWEFLSRIDGDERLHHVPVALMSAHDSVKRALNKYRDEIGAMRLLFPKPLHILRLISTVRHFCSDDGYSPDEAPTTRLRPLPA